MISRKAALFALAVCAILVLASAGCGASDKTDSASSSGCAALVVEFDGHTYRSTAAKVAPVSGDPLGRVTVPPCRDTPGAGEEAAEEIELMAIEGVPRDVAVMRRGEQAMIFVRDGVDSDDFPPALARLLRTPR